MYKVTRYLPLSFTQTTCRSICPATQECILPMAVILYRLMEYCQRTQSKILTEFHVYAGHKKEISISITVKTAGVLRVPFFVVWIMSLLYYFCEVSTYGDCKENKKIHLTMFQNTNLKIITDFINYQMYNLSTYTRITTLRDCKQLIFKFLYE